MAQPRPIPRTLLPLDQYARIMGLDPVHFFGAAGATFFPLLPNSCEDVWVRESWMFADQVSLMELANEILLAEKDIANFLGYWPAPTWVPSETVQYPSYYRSGWYGNGRNANGNWKALETRWGKIIEVGRRVATAIELDAAVVYSDEDGDGFTETATITVTFASADDIPSDLSRVGIYYAGYSGVPEWEIRTPRSISVSGLDLIIVADVWLMIDPSLTTMYPTTDGYEVVNIEEPTSFVATVDVYEEGVDTTAAAVEFRWEPNAAYGCGSCAACNGLALQTACAWVIDGESKLVGAAPAVYNETDAAWQQTAFSFCREPDTAKVWYRAGVQGASYLQGTSNYQLDDYMAVTVAYLATSRLQRAYCACGNAAKLADWLQEDLALSNEAGTHLLEFSLTNNPFGTMRGEIMTYHRLAHLNQRQIDAAVI